MRRMKVGLIPAVMLAATFGAAGAQTRTAPSIGDAVRGVSVRGVPLPGQQNCSTNSGYGYDGRYDRGDQYARYDRYGRYDAKASEAARKEGMKKNRKNDRDGDDRDYNRNGQSSVYQGCCANNGTYGTSRDPRTSSSRGNGNGTGTIDARRGTTVNGGVYNGSVYNGSRTTQDGNRNNSCGYSNAPGNSGNHRNDDHHKQADRDNYYDRR